MIEDPTFHPTTVLCDAGLMTLRDTWKSWQVGQLIPPRSAFDPIAFPRQLPLMKLTEVLREPNQIRSYDVVIRYMGTGWTELFNAAHLTNTKISDLGPIYGERWFSFYDRVIAARAPVTVRGAPFGVDKEFLGFEMLGLPLSKTGDSVDYVLGVIALLPRSRSSDGYLPSAE